VRFALSEDVLAVRDGLRSALRAHCPTELLRDASSPDGDERVRGLWRLLGDMGVPGLVVPELRGGLGCDEIFMVVALEELGYVAAPGPLGEVISMAAPLLADAPGQEEFFDRVLAGDALVACDTDEGHVAHAQMSDGFIVVRDGELGFVSRSRVHVDPVTTVDATRRSGRVRVDGAPATLPLAGLPRAIDRVTLAVAAELVGLSARMLDMTTQYVQTREQFGVPVGSFQAVKHALANSLIAVEFARPAVWRAAASMASGDHWASRDISMAKALATDTARQVARTSIQCHGAMGYSVEYDLHHFVKRSWARCADWGDSEVHVARVAQWLEI
jgi:alkylation response protein AidB-like acyl-CoA dehydrogenase